MAVPVIASFADNINDFFFMGLLLLLLSSFDVMIYIFRHLLYLTVMVLLFWRMESNQPIMQMNRP